MKRDEYRVLLSRASRDGIRLTRQRKAILRTLCELEGHETADQIYRHAIEYHEGMDLSTVYRTLEVLRDRRIISRTEMGQGRSLYELMPSIPHHHLVCRCCGGVTDLGEVYLAPLYERIQQDLGFRPLIDHAAIFGLCEQCAGSDQLTIGGQSS
jgi:Fur family ferric uptake transcriptional regulator